MSAAPENGHWVPVGRISGLYGVRGMVRVFSYTEVREGILDYPVWYLGPGHRPFRVVEGRRQGQAVVVELEGVEDRESARGLMGLEISVPLADLPSLDPQEYYWAELLGFRVENLEGETVGLVAGFLETGANDVMVLRGGDGQELLVPWTEAAAGSVDRQAGKIVVDWHLDW